MPEEKREQARILRNHVGGVERKRRPIPAIIPPILILFAVVAAAVVIIGPEQRCLPVMSMMRPPTYDTTVHREYGGAAFTANPGQRQLEATIQWSASQAKFVNESGFLEAKVRLVRTDTSTVDMVVPLSVGESHTGIIQSWGWDGGADIKSVLLEGGSEASAVLYIDFSPSGAQEASQSNSSGHFFLDKFHVGCTDWSMLTEVEVIA